MKIKPCPFCGNENKDEFIVWENEDILYLECPCGVMLFMLESELPQPFCEEIDYDTHEFSLDSNTAQTIIKKWNKRV